MPLLLEIGMFFSYVYSKVWLFFHVTSHEYGAFDLITNLGLGPKNGTFVRDV